LSLSACGTIIDGQSQEVTLKTPGAAHAECTIDNGGIKYDAYTDQTINIRRMPNNLMINCLAAGNREKTVYVKRDVNDWVFLNVANGFVPGAAYDYFAGGAFTYPDVLTVDFTGQPIKPYDMPKHYAEGVAHNKGSEYMGSSVVATPKDGRISTLPMKDNNFGQSSYSSAYEPTPYTASPERMGGAVYSRSNSVVPYDPAEEMK